MDSQREQALLAAAAREFATTGFQGASLNRIIRRCRISKSSFYYYFDDKAALFDAVVRRAAGQLGAELRIPAPAGLDGPQFWLEVERLAGALLAIAARGDWYADFGKLFYLSDAPAGPARALPEVRARITAWFGAVLRIGRESGMVRTDVPAGLQAELVAGVLQALDRWTLRHPAEVARLGHGEAARLQVGILRRLLAPVG